MTVLKVELADIAFALDSMLAAVALAVTFPELGDFHVGGINGGQFIVMLLGGIIGLDYYAFCCTTVCCAIGEISIHSKQQHFLLSDGSASNWSS